MRLSKYNFKHRLSDDVLLIMNTLTGAVDLVEPKVARVLFNRSSDTSALNDLDPETRTLLKSRGYLTDMNEEQYVRESLETYYRSHPALQFTICPTYKCNLACPYCFQSDIHQDSPTLDLAQINEIFQAMDQMVHLKPEAAVQFELFGASPSWPVINLRWSIFYSRLLSGVGLFSPLRTVPNSVRISLFCRSIRRISAICKSHWTARRRSTTSCVNTGTTAAAMILSARTLLFSWSTIYP